jgi:pimeloyl-ACP methyl ester carboxylesterase
MWDSQFAYFAQHYQVIRYDMRGFGQSSLPTGPYAHIDDLRALLDHLNLTSARLVGLSRGGSVALDFTLTHPQRVEKLVLVDTVLGGYRWSTEQRQLDQAVWEIARTEGLPAGKAAWLRHPLFAPALEQPAVAQHFAQMLNDYSGWHFLNRDLDQRLAIAAVQRLHEIHCPTLVVVGERDLADFLEIAEQLAAGIPGAQKIVLPSVGHMANMEAPDAFNATLLAFLSEDDSGE